jgi:hypothetical protein
MERICRDEYDLQILLALAATQDSQHGIDLR